MNRRGATRAVVVMAAATSLAIVLARVARRPVGTPVEPAAAPHTRTAPAWLRRFVTRRFNPMMVGLRLVGGRRSPWAFLEHVGRRSGAVYRTPILPSIVGDFAYVPLPYGVDVHWSRNVRVAGHCRIERHGIVYQLDEPTMVDASDLPGLPGWYRSVLERRGSRLMRLHVLSTTPGTLDAVPTEPRTPLPHPDDAPSAV